MGELVARGLGKRKPEKCRPSKRLRQVATVHASGLRRWSDNPYSDAPTLHRDGIRRNTSSANSQPWLAHFRSVVSNPAKSLLDFRRCSARRARCTMASMCRRHLSGSRPTALVNRLPALRAPLPFRAILGLPQPSAFTTFARSFSGRCPAAKEASPKGNPGRGDRFLRRCRVDTQFRK